MIGSATWDFALDQAERAKDHRALTALAVELVEGIRQSDGALSPADKGRLRRIEKLLGVRR
jgi:hypothetical protein